MDIDEWPNSNKFWLYNLCCNDYDKLVKRMKAHSELEGWSVKDLGNVPMDFVATDRAIYDHPSVACPMLMNSTSTQPVRLTSSPSNAQSSVWQAGCPP